MRTKTTNWYWVSKGNRRRMHGTVPLSEWIPGIAPFYAHRLFCNLLWCKRVEQRDHKQLLLLPPSLSLPPPPPNSPFPSMYFFKGIYTMVCPSFLYALHLPEHTHLYWMKMETIYRSQKWRKQMNVHRKKRRKKTKDGKEADIPNNSHSS